MQESIGPAEARSIELGFVPTSLWVRSDPLLLRRIVQNLLSNAVRYAEGGRVLLGARRTDGGESVRIEVHDTGPGIAPSEHTRIFDAYARASTGGEGLGLGLAIVKRSAELLGHALSLRSEPGRGSCFSVTVPRAAGRAVAAATAPESSLAGFVVAMVDDDEAVIEAMRTLLEGWGCEIVAGTSGGALRDAVRAATRRPQAIVADYRLGDDETGLDAIAMLRSDGVDCPALLISADEAAPPVGADSVPLLRKPVAPFQLRAALSALLRQSPRRFRGA